MCENRTPQMMSSLFNFTCEIFIHIKYNICTVGNIEERQGEQF